MTGIRSARRASVGTALVLVVLGFTVGAGTAAAPAAPARTAGASPCKTPARSFVPDQATIPAIGRQVHVIQVARTSDNAVGAGPLTESGKWQMAMDPQTRPGSRQGAVLLSGHTWPDGSALGNAMLENLGSGDRIVLTGDTGEKACYGIYKRKSYPVDDVPSDYAFSASGPARLVIVACSGNRTSPGHWTRRTLWYALPVTDDAPKPPPTKPPSTPPDDSSGGLLGGVLGGLLGGK